MDARALTAPPVLAATLEIAGLVVRIACAHAKPVWWAGEAHPAFACVRSPDLDVVFTYDETYWERGLPWIAADAVPDAPEVTGRGESLTLEAAYYRAELHPGAGRAQVRIASGFRADGPMRALCALVLPARGVLLLRAARVVAGDGAVLLVGPSRRIVPSGAFDGWVAVRERDGRWLACTTPLQDGGDPATEVPVERRLDAIRFSESGGDGAAALSPAETARRLFPHLCVVDRGPAAVSRLLDLTARLAMARPAYIEEGA